jgi:predicted DNA-binding transcriptional regulator YafY
MLASRLLSILMLLQARGHMSAATLAREFEVSVRTIHRDIDQLSAAGVPVYAERGRSGGFRLLDGYRTQLTGLTAPEAESLFLTGLPGPAAQLGLADVLAAARLKLLAALPARVQPGVERIASRFHLDPAGWFQGSDPFPSLQPVARATWSGHYLELRYRRAGEAEARPRKLGPLGLVLKGGAWYLVAQAGNAGGKSIRTYRVANIHDPRISSEAFARPMDFDLAAYWDKASRDYEAGVYRAHADVRLSPRGVALLELLGPYVMAAARRSTTPDQGKQGGEGWVRCRLPIESIGHGVGELLRLGQEVEVLGPPTLRDEIARTLATLVRRYRARAAQPPAQISLLK